jgi:hypothetical protein
MNKHHLGASAAAPRTADEIATLGQPHSENSECSVPVPDDAPPLPTFKKHGHQPDDCFEYPGCDGSVLGYVLRWDAREGRRKEFSPATYWRNGSGGTWRLKSWPGQRPLFGLDRLANRPDAIVLLLEGERKAMAVERGPLAHAFKWGKQQVIGMAWPGGAEAVKHADFSPLTGRNVIVVPDNDEVGEKAADQLVELLHQAGVRRLRRWKPPAQCMAKWDIADPLPPNITAEALVDSILSAPEVATPRIIQTIEEFIAGYVAPDFLIDGLLLKHFCYSLTGAPGSGKTALVLLIASLIASRTPSQRFGAHEVEHGRVVYVAAENSTDIRMRLIGMAAKKKLDLDPSDFLVVEQIRNLDDDLPRIRSEVEAFGEVDLVIIDTSPSVFPGDNENDTVQMLNHAKRLRKLCDLPGRPTVLALCHPTKHVSSPDSLLPRGGGAFIGELDGNFSLWAHDDRLADFHYCGKYRGPQFAKITIRLTPVTTTQLVDKKGRLLPTVMAEVVSEAEATANAAAALAQEDQLLIAMLHRPRATLEQWASACRWFVNGDPQKPNKSAAHRVMKRLAEDNLVKKEGRDFILTTAGKTAAKKIGAVAGEGEGA